MHLQYHSSAELHSPSSIVDLDNMVALVGKWGEACGWTLESREPFWASGEGTS